MSYNVTYRIKNLSFALEAVSRINGCRSEYDRIRDLLSEAIEEEKENQKAQSDWPATPTVQPIPSR